MIKIIEGVKRICREAIETNERVKDPDGESFNDGWLEGSTVANKLVQQCRKSARQIHYALTASPLVLFPPSPITPPLSPLFFIF